MATEPDAEMVKRAEKHLKEKGITNVELRRAAAQDLPFEDGSFDTVVSCLVFCHVGGDAPVALAGIKRVLKPGGSFRFMEHVRNDASGFGGRFQDFVNPAWKRHARERGATATGGHRRRSRRRGSRSSG